MRKDEVEKWWLENEEDQVAAVENNGIDIRWILNPSEKVQLAAVYQTGYAINYIKNPSEAALLIYLSKAFPNSWAGDSLDNLDKNKVISKLLNYIKRERWHAVSHLITGLRIKRYKWPELDIIEKSVRKEMKINEVMTRRDFMGGIAVTVAGATIPGKITPDSYPGPSVSPIPSKKPVPKPLIIRKISEELIRAVIYQESRGYPNRVNKRTGAAGMMQIMPKTWAKPGYGVEPGEPGKILDARANIKFGVKLLRAFLKRYDGDLIKILAAYNWGPGQVNRWDGEHANLPKETRQYILEIIDRVKGKRPSFIGKL